MPAGPFTISKDFIHGTEEGCIRVTAVPHIIIYRIPHDFAQNLTAEAELKQAGIYLLLNTEANTLYVGQADSRDNGNRPHATAVTFSTKTLLNNYTDFAFFLLRVEMGCDAFEPVKKTKKAPKKTAAPVSSV